MISSSPRANRRYDRIYWERLLFDWDEANEEHVQRHGVEPREAVSGAPTGAIFSRTMAERRRRHRIDGRPVTRGLHLAGDAIRVITARTLRIGTLSPAAQEVDRDQPKCDEIVDQAG
jgi:hypothetical protein